MKVPTRQVEGRREAVRGMFAAISPSYDRLNHLLSAGQDIRWRKRAVGMFGPDVKRVLDVAAGTGDLSAAWLAADSENQVLATDFVPEMCVAGAEKLRDRPGLLGYAVADALALPAADGAFDGVMAAFGVRNFENLSAGIGEMARILRPGGELLVLEFFPARNAFVDSVFRAYFHHVLPRVGAMISGDREAYSYLPKSVGDFVTRERFSDLLLEHGFGSMRKNECSGGIATAFHAVLDM